jgi:hypothetical protein
MGTLVYLENMKKMAFLSNKLIEVIKIIISVVSASACPLTNVNILGFLNKFKLRGDPISRCRRTPREFIYSESMPCVE